MNTNSLSKICEHCKEKFLIKDDEFVLYTKVGIELPVLCFFCRLKLLFSFWPFGKFRKGLSDLSGESFITVLPEKPRYPIYTLSEWYSDKWDAMSYGQNYDSSQSFFTQLKALQEKVPRPHQLGSKNTGCDWCDDVWESKNCYLSRSMIGCEDLLYSYRNINVKNSIDAVICFNSERIYDCADCYNSYKLFYSTHSRDCIDSYFLYDCRNCQNCFMSWNLRNKQYCIENVQYSKEEYEKKLSEYNLGIYSSVLALKERFHDLIQNKVVHRQNFNYKSYDSEGDYLLNVKNCKNCFTLSESEDCHSCVRGMGQKSSIDIVGSFNIEISGNSCCCQPSGYALKYCVHSPSRYGEYLDNCIECEYCFGCVGIQKKKYCILNKQYTKEEYEVLKEKIIIDMKQRGEYGKFFPYDMAICDYNFSNAMIYFPDTQKNEILEKGGYWLEVDESHIEGVTTSELPDAIGDVSEDITTKALVCPETGWRFNISPNELSFYRINNIPLPRQHFDVRLKNRLQYITVLQAYPYACFYCQKDINAYYPPEWGYQKVACEDCYKQNIA